MPFRSGYAGRRRKLVAFERVDQPFEAGDVGKPGETESPALGGPEEGPARVESRSGRGDTRSSTHARYASQWTSPGPILADSRISRGTL
jgi:hypothetical protein